MAAGSPRHNVNAFNPVWWRKAAATATFNCLPQKPLKPSPGNLASGQKQAPWGVHAHGLPTPKLFQGPIMTRLQPQAEA